MAEVVEDTCRLRHLHHKRGFASRQIITGAYACEGWHNNHHYYETASRQGFFWWEIDITWYMLKGMSALGLIWDLKGVPSHIKYSRNREHARDLKKLQQQKEQRETVTEAA